jgi:hypothetical protein
MRTNSSARRLGMVYAAKALRTSPLMLSRAAPATFQAGLCLSPKRGKGMPRLASS